jgi:hypothetical protein
MPNSSKGLSSFRRSKQIKKIDENDKEINIMRYLLIALAAFMLFAAPAFAAVSDTVEVTVQVNQYCAIAIQETTIPFVFTDCTGTLQTNLHYELCCNDFPWIVQGSRTMNTNWPETFVLRVAGDVMTGTPETIDSNGENPVCRTGFTDTYAVAMTVPFGTHPGSYGGQTLTLTVSCS